ncbi:alpha/beta hydrolase [Krasilnikoviella flava]|uniref:PGAP1-like protein n=1 Tax=Krasilnikoviella flava TaxID=526729 RepID=A0A1T5LXX1_9MICO|nr:alpha/beta hydrolase [Krasilnikoviella flava]SKC80811.1 PGAP1-like protein [Krasilnikoviella flava]
MTRGLPPEETLAVVGGRSVSRVDADAVQGAAALLDDAGARLRRASRECAAARGAVLRAVWAPDPLAPPFSPRPGAVEAALAQAAGTRLDDAAARLRLHATAAERCARRLRFAAGLYRHAESVAQRVADGAVTLLAGAAGLWLGLRATPLLAGAAVGDRLRGEPDPRVSPAPGATTVPRAPAPPPPPTGPVTTGHDGPLAGVWRVAAPLSDDAVAGLGAGLSATRPWTWQDLRRGFAEGPAAMVDGVTRSADALSDVVGALLPASVARVVPLTDEDLAGPPPAWTDRPAGTVAEALARTADLYGQGSEIVGRPAAGAPQGTLAVEEVTHDDGTTSWTVLVPGTQALLSPTHLFDAATDLELMAHEAADVSAAVEQALDVAGATPDQPVVLVGHSLGGIAATALAASPEFREKHVVGGVVTAGSPTATFALPAGVPALHLENDEELVSAVDGRSSRENPASADRVTVGRRLLDSVDPADVTAAGSVVLAHTLPAHLRTLTAARSSGNTQVAGVTGRLERLLDGARARTRFYAVRRAGPAPATVLAPGTVLGTTAPPPGVPTGATLH